MFLGNLVASLSENMLIKKQLDLENISDAPSSYN